MTTTDKLAERLDAAIVKAHGNYCTFEYSSEKGLTDLPYTHLTKLLKNELQLFKDLRTTLTTQQSEINRLREASKSLMDRYIEVVTGDAFPDWDPHKESEIIDIKHALAEGESRENT